MKSIHFTAFGSRWLLLMAISSTSVGLAARADGEKPFGLDQRVPWTTSRVIGSPEPPPPYKVEPVFTNIKWQRPIYAKAEPGTNHILVVQQGGEKDLPSKVLRIKDDPATREVHLLLEVPGRLVYGVEFHPDYSHNRQLFVFSNSTVGGVEQLNRISRFIVSAADPPTCDLESEQVIIEWRSAGHDGGDLVFGHDGMLYIATGDGTTDSDTWLSAQDITNLLGGVLRIDVDHPTSDRPYSIPQDNPFLHLKNARGELWAFGLRNPWRMTVDHETGQIWVGNNGQDTWETVHLVRRGENYGWSVYEGNHPFYLHRPLGPAPFTPPTVEHHHTEARSLTGGVVYYGQRLPELRGTYIYGDYTTGKVWGVRHDGANVTWRQELTDTSLQITAFAQSHQGELLIVDHAGGLYRLLPNVETDEAPPFPQRLSETGLFRSVAEHQVEAGVIPYSVIAPGWNDGAHVERFVAVPKDEQIDYTSLHGWTFPNGTVLMQTLSLEEGPAQQSSRRRIETRLLTRHQGEWAGYSYRWNDRQDDASLVSRQGADVDLAIVAAGVGGDISGQPASRRWRFPSRAECMTCHSRAANFVLGTTELQMNREHDYGAVCDNQLRTFEHIGLFRGKLPAPVSDQGALVDPYDAAQELGARARSYLHVNCSSCHIAAGGGNARMELEVTRPLQEMNVVSMYPQHDTFGIERAMLITPGDPDRSILYQRVRRRGPGQMPPLVTNTVDVRAAELFRQWIKGMEPQRPFVKEWKLQELAPALEEVVASRSFEAGRAAFRDAGCIQCHRFREEGGGAGPDLSGIASRLKPDELLESIVAPSKKIAPEFAMTVLLTSDGILLQGPIASETDEVIVLRAGTSFTEPATVHKSEIEERSVSDKSIMPDGAINCLEKHQILDLLAYLIASGDPGHPAFED